MRALCHFGTFCLAVACARPPSTKPLGGEERLHPEKTSDRRPHRAPEQARSEARFVASETAPPSGAPVRSPPKTESASAPVKPGEVEFTAEPLAQGSTVTLETRFKLEASIGGMSDTAVAVAHERIEVRIVDATPEAVREVEVSYVMSESSFRFGSGTNEQSSNAGKRFRVRLDSDKAQVTRRSAGKDRDKDNDDEKGVVFDLATVTGYLPLVRPHLPAKLSAGWKAELDKKQLGKVFGEFDSVELERGSLVLRGLSQSKDALAEFDCGMPVRIGRDGFSLSAELKGRCTALAKGARPVDVTLSGPLRMEASNLPGAQLTGTLEASVNHAYSR